MGHQNTKSTSGNIFKLSDEDLVHRIVGNSIIEDYGVIYDRYSKKIFNKCMVFTQHEKAANNLMYDIFIKTFTTLSTFKNKSDFSGWLFSITYNMSVDYVQKEHANGKVSYSEVEAFDKKRVEVVHCDAEKKLLDLTVDELKQVLQKLYPKDRVVLLMYYQDELPIRKIAKQLNIHESTAEKKLILARERAVGICSNIFTTKKSNDTSSEINNFIQLGKLRNPPFGEKNKLMSSVKITHLVLYGMDLFIHKPFALIGALTKSKTKKSKVP